MARYKVDKKLFEKKQLDDQLTQIELQSKYLKDEPLKRSEVDEYNKLKANGWVRSFLITFGIAFLTMLATLVFTGWGAALYSRNKVQISGYDLNSREIFEEFVSIDLNEDGRKDILDILPDPALYSRSGYTYEYPIPLERLNPSRNGDEIYIHYYFTTKATILGNTVTYEWNLDKPKIVNKQYGELYNAKTKIGGEDASYVGYYVLDKQETYTSFTDSVRDYFRSFPSDSWAYKVFIESQIVDVSFLVLILHMFFWLTVVIYSLFLVVGIRYVIRVVIGTLRRAGYIASDFVTEVVDSVRSELPIVDEDQAEELDLVAVRKQVQKKLAQDDSSGGLPEYKFEPEDNLEEDVPKKKESLTDSLKEVKEEDKPVVIASPETVVEEPKEEKKKESKAQDKIIDIFDL